MCPESNHDNFSANDLDQKLESVLHQLKQHMNWLVTFNVNFPNQENQTNESPPDGHLLKHLLDITQKLEQLSGVEGTVEAIPDRVAETLSLDGMLQEKFDSQKAEMDAYFIEQKENFLSLLESHSAYQNSKTPEWYKNEVESRFKENISRLTEENKNLNEEYLRLKEENSRNHTALTRNKEQLIEKDREILHLNGVIKSLNDTIENNERTNKNVIQELKSTESTLLSSLESCRDNNKELKEEISHLKEHCEKIEEAFAFFKQKANGEIATLEAKVEDAQFTLKSTEEKLQKTESTLQATQNTLEKTEKSLDSTKLSLREAQGSLEETVQATSKKFGGFDDLAKPYVDLGQAVLTSFAARELLHDYGDLNKNDAKNIIKFISFVGSERNFAIELYNCMRKYQAVQKEGLTRADKAMIQAVNLFYQVRDGIEFEVMVLPEENQKFNAGKVQDLEKPGNTRYREYTEVYVPAIMKDESTVAFQAVVKGKN